MTLPPEVTHARRRWQLQLSERRILLMLGDAAAIFVAVVLSLTIWVIVDGRGLGVRFVVGHLYWFPILAGLWLLLASANDFYSLRISSRIDTSLMRLVQVTLQIVVVYLAIFFFSPRTALPRLFIFYYAFLSFFLIMAWRLWRPFLLGWTGTPRRALMIGSGQSARTLLDALHSEAPDDYTIVGMVAEPGSDPPADPQIPLIADGRDLPRVTRQADVSELILAYEQEPSGELFQAIMDCYEQGISIIPMPLLYEQVTGRVPIEHVGQRYWMSMLPIEAVSIFNPYPLVKRAADLMLSIVGLAFFGLLLPLIAVAMKLDSPGPIFFRQRRVGKSGRLFWLYKLRSMIPDAERDTGPRWASDDDPRITRVGRLLRKTRLDEMPQLYNVLRGEMSIIGPRPERPEFVEELSQTIPFYRTRHVVKPGITGWAQVRYRYGASEEDALIKLQYDLYYIRHRSIALDVLIILRTIGKMLALQGT